MPNLNPELKAVIENDLCIACGACIPACPRGHLAPAFDTYRGANEVGFLVAADCSNCEAPCVAVCPSVKIDFAAISDPPRPTPERDGWIRGIHLGYSPQFRDDGKSSSGGVLRALAHLAAEEGMPVLTLAKLEGATIEYRPHVLRDESDLARMPGSIYHSTSFVGAIEHLRELDRPCLLIAIPCQLAGIYNYISKIEPGLRDKIGYSCGIICGWMYSHHAHQTFLRLKGLDIPLTDISYRGGDKVGKLKLMTERKEHVYDRRVFSNRSSALDYQSAYSTDLNRLRCRLCEDHTNLLADIIAGDAWLARKGKEKLSVIGIRTDRGQELFDRLVERGHLEAEAGSYADIIESQGANLIYGVTARKLSMWLRRRGGATPLYQFAPNHADIRLRLGDRLAFRLEFMRRHVVRARHYALFRWLYLAKSFTKSALKMWAWITKTLQN